MITLRPAPARILWLLLLCYGHSVSAEITTRVFDPGSYQEILSSYREQPLLIVLWSLDCPPCLEEFPLLKELPQHHPRLPLVMISVDGEEATSEIRQLLNLKGMEQMEHWVFRHQNSQKLRHEVDPRWYGELPRLYLFDDQHQRQARSGRISRSELKAWLESMQ